MRTYSREDVQTHSDGFGPRRPAVNVKIYRSVWDNSVWDEFQRDEGPDEGFTREWIEANVDEQRLDHIFARTCENELEYLEEWATSDEDAIFPDHRVQLIQEGRSGGWIAVNGLPDLEDWDAVLLARWRRFERIARSIADGVPVNVLASVYINEYEWAVDEQTERVRAANQDIATLERTP